MHTPHDLFFNFSDLLIPLRLIRSANLQVHNLTIFVAIDDILGNYQVLIRNLMTVISSIFLKNFFIWFERVEIVLQLLHRRCYLTTILTVWYI